MRYVLALLVALLGNACGSIQSGVVNATPPTNTGPAIMGWPRLSPDGISLNDVSGFKKKDLPHFVRREWILIDDAALEANIKDEPWFGEDGLLRQVLILAKKGDCKSGGEKKCSVGIVAEIQTVVVGPKQNKARYCLALTIAASPEKAEAQMEEVYFLPDDDDAACVVAPPGLAPGKPFLIKTVVRRS